MYSTYSFEKGIYNVYFKNKKVPIAEFSWLDS